MRHVEVEAVEDRSRAEGGHAVIILRGVGKSVGDARFELRPAPLDQDDPSADEPSLTGLEPLDIRDTEDGLALYLGPDITQTAAFAPGSAVEIILPAAGVRGEFLWPAVTPVVRPKRRNIMTRRSMTDPLVRPSKSPEEPPVSERTVVAAEPPAAERPERTVVRPEPAEGTVPAARRPIVLTSSLARRAVAAEEAVEAPPRQSPRSSDAPVRAEPLASKPTVDVVRVDEPARPVIPDRPGQVERSAASEELPPSPSKVIAEASRRAPEVAQPAEATRQAAPEAMPPPSVQMQPAQVRRGISTAAAVSLAVVGVAAAQLVALRVFDLSLVSRREHAAATVGQPNAPAAVTASTKTLSAPSAKAARATEPPAAPAADLSAVYDVIAVGGRSPRGVAADDVTSAKALELAHGLLHTGEGKRDPEEAAFWLKRYLAGAQGSENIRIALTQLGSAYAQPVDGKRDFGSARIVWELASGLGDPVAMCFLGAMHEHGLGRPASPAAAATWYERAGALGRRCAAAQRAEAAPGR